MASVGRKAGQGEATAVAVAHPAGILSPEDRQVLERFAPYLQYDAQDGYRAVSAATMTDPPCNCLASGSGAPIAGKGTVVELNLDVLAKYPNPYEFANGDHLNSAPNPLEDAVKYQRDPRFPHCTYGRVARREGRAWLEYWLWYYDNPKKFFGQGRHQGDWEMVIVEVGPDGEPRTVTCSQHNAGEARRWDRVDKREGRPLIYVAPFSHANYFEPGTHFYFPGADHPTSQGPCRRPEVAEFGAWQSWRGRWGATLGPLRGRLNIWGTSPEAPVAQSSRWARPWTYHAKSVARKPVAWFFRTLWFLGKATFPCKPELPGATLAGTEVSVPYEMPQRGLHRGRHLLLTVHSADDTEDMLVSQAFKNAPRSGTQVLRLPREPEGGCIVYASVFNFFGQRSDPEHVAGG
ncbi:MAG: hypothetical protein WA696_17890 [Solirubrobacterales bacterium]